MSATILVVLLLSAILLNPACFDSSRYPDYEGNSAAAASTSASGSSSVTAASATGSMETSVAAGSGTAAATTTGSVKPVQTAAGATSAAFRLSLSSVHLVETIFIGSAVLSWFC